MDLPSIEYGTGSGETFRAVGYAVLECTRLRNQVFRREAAKRNALFLLSVTGFGKPALGEIDRGQHETEQALISGRTGERLGKLSVSKCRKQPRGRPFEIRNRRIQARRRFAEPFSVRRGNGSCNLPEFGNEAAHMRAIGKRQLAGDQVDRLDPVGPFIDWRDAGVAEI